ncbi:histone H2A deubiquitinase MYSM1 isoform X1 [Poecilia latipinna]|uniref:histone H2A deubiquitinase MYSM1 isoform X1 n=1 Tax=Poecilia latipinna TaxID=48699 RepID=UPI00072E2DB7|nr:PREDICTED: histone H2A deubiquitinase MYSM1 isoform X1 [Poecilia latipinna]
MEDEVDVDIEGDDFDSNVGEVDAAGLVQEQFIQPADRTSSWILPWELDSSISPENREAIERMLLEEQYYLTGDRIPDILPSDPNKKPKVKKSPTKSSTSASASSRWSKQEKELFEEGLAQYGRRWTKIAKLVDTRSVLQVKSYARQYFKHKGKSEPGAAAPSRGPEPQLRPPRPTMTNAVRIERLSDDEDVDITDDLSEGEGEDMKIEPSGPAGQPQTDAAAEEQKEPTMSEGIHETKHRPCPSSPSEQSPPSSFNLFCAEEDRKTTSDENLVKTEPPEAEAETESKLTTNPGDEQSCQSHTLAHDGQLTEEGHDSTDSVENLDIHGPDGDPEEQQEEEEEDEEVEELKAPEQEVEMDTEMITEDEKQAIPEFFEGRPSKTPERYLKIRNYILDQWLKSKPRYLNKTSVRPGLKNCGDVNCIGRIHTYLELIGAINFNCEQAVYNRPKVVDRTKPKEGKDVLEAYQLAQRLQSMRTRKRRVRDVWGNWCDARDLEGQTYEHLSAEELAQRREEMKKQPKPGKTSRYRGSFDPFQLIPCRSFERDVQEPFQVIVCAETLLIMDMHAHVSRGEVIGLLGGTFNQEEKVLKIRAAEPCNSVSTGLQCEMDPVSQTQACDVLSSLGFSVVGWYHSHPSFHPNPSVRDINTQDQFQSYFSRGGAPFIGMIVSPYDPANPSTHSQITCLLVKESQEPSSQNKLPYRFNFLSSQDSPDWEQTMRRAQWIVQKYAQAHGSVQMDRLFRRDSSLTCLEKMMASLARHLEALPDGEGDQVLSEIQALFLSDFVSKQKSSCKEEEQHLNISSSVQSDDDAFDQLIGQEEFPNGGESAETNSSSVLHLGSVLSTEHDYLL